MTHTQGSELLAAAWSSTAILSFTNDYNLFGWIAVLFALVDFIIGVANA